MKLKFFIAGMAIVAGLASAVSCQDLSKDLTALQNKVASLESTVQSLQDKINSGAVITSVTPTNSGIVITLSNGNKYEITNGVNGKDGTNGKDGVNGKDGTPGSVVTIGEDGNWYIDGKDTGMASKGADGTPGVDGLNPDYYVPNAKTGCFDKYSWDAEKGEYVATPTEISFLAPGTITAVYNPLTGAVTLYGVEGYEGGYVITNGEVGPVEPKGEIKAEDAAGTNGMTMSGDYMVTLRIVDMVDNEFHGMTFVKGENEGAPYYANVRISPADAVLTAEDLAFVNSKGEELEMVKVINVEKAIVAPITKADDITSAVWKVTYAIDYDVYDEDEFLKATLEDPEAGFILNNRIAFALKADEAATDYIFLFDAPTKAPELTSANLLAATVGTPAQKKAGTDVAISTLRNRVNDATWLGTKKDYETPATAKKGDGSDPTKSNWNPAGDSGRTGNPKYNVDLNKEFHIYAGDVAALFIELDMENVTDQSEKVAWEKYANGGIDGLGLVEGNEAVITITDPSAKADEIVFRVSAVNHSGTLLDPDGAAFTVIVGETSEKVWDVVNAVVTPVKAGDFGIPSDFAAVKAEKLEGAVAPNLKMDKTTDPTFIIEGVYAADKKTAAKADWSDAAFIRVTPTATGYDKYVDDKEYSATVTIPDANGFVLATFPITLKKALPTKAPATISIKEGMLVDNTYTYYVDYSTLATPNAGIDPSASWTPGGAAPTTVVGAVELIRKATVEAAKLHKAKTYDQDYYYQWVANNTVRFPFDLAALYKFSDPTEKTNFTTTIAGAKKMVGANKTSGNPDIDDDPSKWNQVKSWDYKNLTVAADGTFTLNNAIVDNQKHAAKVVYDFGAIKCDKNGKVTNHTVEAITFDILFKAPGVENTWSWNWNVYDGADPAAKADVDYPNHNARVVYRTHAGLFATAYETVDAWTPGTGETYKDDKFAVEYAPHLYLAGTADLGYAYDGTTKYSNISAKGDKSAFTGTLDALINKLIVIPADHVADPALGETGTGTIYAATLGTSDYYTANYTGGWEFNLVKVTAAAEPAAPLAQDLVIHGFDMYAHPVTITLPTTIVPKP